MDQKVEVSFAYHRQILPTSGIKSSSLWEVRSAWLQSSVPGA